MKTPILRNARAREAAPGRLERLPRAHARHHVAGRRGRRRAWRPRVDRVCAEADAALADGVNVLILSDRALGPERAPIPSLLAVGSRAPPPRARGHAPADRPRARVRRAARGPPLRHADRLRRQRDQPVPDVRVARRARATTAACPASTTSTTAETNVVKGIAKGLLKTISKMGISTIQSYNGAQIFEAVGLGTGLIDRASPAPRRGSAASGSTCWRAETLDKHARAYPQADQDAAAGRRHLRVAARRRAPHVEPGDDRAAPARRPPRRPADLRGVRAARQRGRRARARRCAGCCSSRSCPRTSGCRSTRSSRPRRSSSASRPARCRSARSRARRTRRWRSR